jgi:hypothetical protein
MRMSLPFHNHWTLSHTSMKLWWTPPPHGAIENGGKLLVSLITDGAAVGAYNTQGSVYHGGIDYIERLISN